MEMLKVNFSIRECDGNHIVVNFRETYEPYSLLTGFADYTIHRPVRSCLKRTMSIKCKEEYYMNGLIRSIIPAVVCVTLGLGATSAMAAGQCKGLSKSACSADSSCSWVNSYVTKSGKKVDSYCRVRAGKKQAVDKQSGSKGQTKKADKGKEAEKSKKTEKSKKVEKKSKETAKP